MSLSWSDLEFASLANPSSTPTSSADSKKSPPPNIPRKRSIVAALRRTTLTQSASSDCLLNVSSSGGNAAIDLQIEGEDACILSVQLLSALLGIWRRFERFFSPGGKLGLRVRETIRSDESYLNFSNQVSLFVFWIFFFKTTNLIDSIKQNID